MEGQKAAGRTRVLQVSFEMSSQGWVSPVFWQHWWWDGAGGGMELVLRTLSHCPDTILLGFS